MRLTVTLITGFSLLLAIPVAGQDNPRQSFNRKRRALSPSAQSRVAIPRSYLRRRTAATLIRFAFERGKILPKHIPELHAHWPTDHP